MNDILDIKYQDLIDWLKSRNLIPKEWTKSLKAVQLKMRELIEKIDILSDKNTIHYVRENKEDFSYFHLEKAISMLLQTTESQQKSFFGGYTNQLIKDWIAIEKFYRKDNIHLISLAKLLIQSVQYEIPGFVKNVTMLENQIKYSIQKKQEYENTIKQQQAEYENQCAKLGIDGVNLEKEITALASKLPEHFRKIESAAKGDLIKKGINYYYDFTLYVNSKSSRDNIRLHLIDQLVENGDEPVSLYEKRRKAEKITDEDLEQIKIKYDWYQKYLMNNQKTDEINWNITEAAPETGGISWEIEDNTNKESDQGNKISWDIGAVGSGQEQSEEVVEIKWDIAENIDQQQGGGIDWQIEDASPPQQNFSEIDTILSNRNYRNQIISDISEIISFLNQRWIEAKQDSSNSILQTYETTGQEGLLDIKSDEIKLIKDSFEQLLHFITNFQIRQLLLIKEQQKSCDRIIGQLNSYKENISRYQQNIKNMIKKQQENEEQVIEYNQNKTTKVSLALELKEIVEKKLNEAVKRKCVLVGDITKLKK